ncbi:MAG: hypothetical protein ACHQHP_04290 [Bacteroidia bacterium]
MERYLEQLLSDITHASANISWPYVKKESYELHDWIAEEEEDKIAPVRQLEEWSGIRKEQLPPAEMLNDEQFHLLLIALIKMLDAYNWSFVLQTEVPERIQYAAIRDNFDQQTKIKQWHMGFFENCRPNTEHGKCALGEYCQCTFFAEMFKDMVDEDLTPEEERKRDLEFEINYLQKKYGDDWMKYYPYHLDPKYDDENGNPHDYGFGNEDEEDGEDWWKK